MRYLFVNSVCGIGSTGKICQQLATELKSQGNDVKIAFGREKAPDNFPIATYNMGTKKINVRSGLSVRFFDNEGLNNRKETKEFLAMATNYNPDVLWLHNLHGYYINYKLLFDWIKSRPQMEVRWTLHDCWSFTGHCAHFTYVGCEKWKTGCENCPQKGIYPKSILFSRAKKNYEDKKKAFTGVQNLTLITPSKWLADLTRESFLKDYPVEVHPNTINTEIFKPTESDFREKYGLQDKKIILGVSAVWNERKGFDDFKELAGKLDDSYKIVLVGVNEVQAYQLPDRILGIMKTENATELAGLYTTADVFVNPTYEDTYPTVNLEA